MNIKTRGILIGAIVLISAILMATAVASAATTYYVATTGNDTTGDGTASSPWKTIQYAVYNTTVSAGDTIIVRNGTYTENVNVNKSLTIKSENGSDSTIVQAFSSSDHVFEVTEDYVNISGFAVRNATGNGKAGIFLNSQDYCNIFDNNASDNYHGIYLFSSDNNSISNNNASNNDRYGIYLYSSSNNNNISGNTALNNTAISPFNPSIGIYLYSSCNNNNISGNTASNNEGYGIYLYSSCNNNNISGNTASNSTAAYDNNKIGIYLSSSCNNNNISGNTASNNYYGIRLSSSSNNNISGNTASSNHNGIFLSSSCNNNSIMGNTASNNYGGIRLQSSCNNNSITGNTASNNTDRGIWLYSSSTNNVTGNTASNNNYGIYLQSSSTNNTIYNNYFSNTQNAWDNGNNIWNITKTEGRSIIGGPNLGGNYWSDYAGEDTDVDGLGDTLTPFTASGKIQNGGDYHPLVRMKMNITIPTATGTGNATITTSSGYFCDATALNESYFLGNVPDSVLTFTHGFFNISICGLNDTNPENVTINFTFPSAIPTDAEFWKYNASNGTWYRYDFGDNDGDNVISITITDNGPGDHNPALGTISDPNGLGWRIHPVPAMTPIGLIALVGLLSALAAVTIVRKRH
jgi:parallel beta-helix repeat protein